jgi:CPA1 family monovalent cation:H+ antiporter
VVRSSTDGSRWKHSGSARGEDWTREDSVDCLRALHEFRYRRATERAGLHVDGTSDENLDARSLAYQRTIRDVLDVQRHELERLRAAGQVSDEVVRALTRELDLEDQRLEI